MSAGPMLREWRRRRRLSQLDLALEAGVSARHLSFVETGRARPSADMVVHLAEQLEIPLRERNRLLIAAGHAPVYEQHTLEDPEMAPVRDTIQRVLDAHEPCPALVIDRHWEMLAANASLGVLLEGVAPELLEPPVNVLRVGLHPAGMAPRIVNYAEWRGHLVERLHRQISLTGDPQLRGLLDELEGYSGPDTSDPGPADEIAVPLKLRGADGAVLTFISTVATFGTAVEVTASELSIETFFPADAETAARLSS